MAETQAKLPQIWLRSFFGFSPEEDGYIGWSREAGQKHMLGKVSTGDLIMVYGAGTGETGETDRHRVLGFLEIEARAVRDEDRASEAGMARKRANGWEGRWSHALPVKRAWRVTQPVAMEEIAFHTYSPEKGRAIAAWSPGLEPEEMGKAFDLQVREVPVYGEPLLALPAFSGPLRDAFPGRHAITGTGRSFKDYFAHFSALVERKSGHPFRGFDEGLAAASEDYKPRLRDYALSLLEPEAWSEDDIGTGEILKRMIAAIEIQDSRVNLTNNLVFWQNRFGHANRDHKALLEAESNPGLRRNMEASLWQLFRGNGDEAALFDELAELTEKKYPLVAYLFFLKDMDRFTPINPTGFDRAFDALGIDYSTARQCNWENYSGFIAILDDLRPLIEEAAGQSNVRLIDAHSFCWIFSYLLKQEAKGELDAKSGSTDAGRVVAGREKSIVDMAYSVKTIVKNSSGQTVERTVKDKQLRMTDMQLEAYITELLDLQEDRCALTGLPLQYKGYETDRNFLPSLDRIDSDGHYELGNLQVVCRFINFWKSDGDNEEFKRLLMAVRGEDME
jgi:hypothetical protein